MNTYLIQSKSGKTKMIFTYNSNGFLISFEAEPSDIKTETLQWIYKHFPYTEAGIDKFKPLDYVTVSKVAADLSFEAFYNLYGYKVGKKERTKRLWDALPEVDRIACLAAIPKYKRWLASKNNMEMLYPETFLSQRRWENEYK
jgi:hypothetical protein